MRDDRHQAHGEQPLEDEAVDRGPAARGRLPLLVALGLLVALAAGITWSAPWETSVASSDEDGAGDDPTTSASDGTQNDDEAQNAGEDSGSDEYAGTDEYTSADLDELPDGEHFGFVTAFTVGAVTFEPAEFLTGDEALEAAREDGAIGPGQYLPNDFYIRYPDTGTLTLPVAADFEASLLDNVDLRQSRTLGVESVTALYAGDLDAPWMYGPLEMLPMALHVEDGEVARADEHYVP